MKKMRLLLLLSSLFFLLASTSALAEEVMITNKPVDFNLNLVDSALSPITNVAAVTYYGIEYRNTDSAMTYPVFGDASAIDGVFVVTSLYNDNGIIFGTGVNDTWEMTATYTSLVDDIIGGDASAFNFSTRQQVGVLTFYVNTMPANVRASTSTGQGYDDGTMVAQFAVYNPDPLLAVKSGGTMQIISPFDGARDMLMTWASGIDGFFTSTLDPSEEVTALNLDSNLDADSNIDGVPANSPPEPTMWNYPLADPVIDWALDYFVEIDGSFRFGTVPRDYPGSCRMTGGGNDKNDNIVLGTLATSEGDRYTYGGQIGAPTADQPQPYGEWTHHQQKGVGDKFIFRSGTASAPKDTKILRVFCQDPCYCVNARPAPFKQISWDGTGHFANMSPKGQNQLNAKCSNDVAPGKDGSRHYYRVHVNDIGEPGSGGLVSKGKGKKSTRSQCDLDLGTFPDLESPYFITEEQCADCPDTYQIEIHCTTDPASDVMYSVGAFVEGGNLQIHPPVGEHMNPGDCP